MKHIGLFCAVAAVSFCSPAMAAKTFNLVGVTLVGGGTLTGSFTTDDSLTHLLGVDIMASAGTVGSYNYNAFAYNDISKANWVSLPTQGFQITYGNVADQLRLNLQNFTAAGATIIVDNSYEYQSQAGPRSVTAGTVVAAPVPEPAAWALMIAGFALIGAAMRRRSTAVSFA